MTPVSGLYDEIIRCKMMTCDNLVAHTYIHLIENHVLIVMNLP